LPRARRPSVVSRSHDYEPPPAPAHPSIILRLGRRRGHSLRSILFLCILTLRMRTLTDILTNANPSGRASRWGGKNLEGCRASSRSDWHSRSTRLIPASTRHYRVCPLPNCPRSSRESDESMHARPHLPRLFSLKLVCLPSITTAEWIRTYEARAREVCFDHPLARSHPHPGSAGCNAEGGRWTRVCDPRWIRLSRMGARNGER
jgi:hypothetical protein